ncbi:MAG: hypothetical protein RL641_289 [Candidatus Parcubacteria bacterium]|jgi:hypothetical protein
MIPTKQNMIIEKTMDVCKAFIQLSTEVSINIDRENRELPNEDIEQHIIELFKSIVFFYRNDDEGLLRLYRSSELWKKAIRIEFQMDDEDEKGYWFYHAFDVKPNALLEIYLAEHPTIGFEKILEMFEHGRREKFLQLELPIKDIVDEKMLNHSTDEILYIIDDRVRNENLSNPKAISQFLAWLFSILPRKIERVLQTYEESENPFCRDIALTARQTLEYEAKEQLSINFS